MQLTVNFQNQLCPIWIERGAHTHLAPFIDTDKPSLLVADDGIPEKWVQAVASQFSNIRIHRFPAGEQNKNIVQWQGILQAMADFSMTRSDQVIALGGGVTGDMAGFAAACYMRGIDFVSMPTTALSQVDSSTGGKTAIDLGPIKNIVGAFHQPVRVLIDPEFLTTLPPRQIANGLAEALKMGLLFDGQLVDAFEKEEPDLEWIIARSIALKASIVEQDEKEAGLRRVLNFGHTIGHAIEGSFADFSYLHGECVALGMLYFIENEDLARRVLAIEKRLGLPKIEAIDQQKALELLRHDKKGHKESVSVVKVFEPGVWKIEDCSWRQIEDLLRENPYEKYDRQ